MAWAVVKNAELVGIFESRLAAESAAQRACGEVYGYELPGDLDGSPTIYPDLSGVDWSVVQEMHDHDPFGLDAYDARCRAEDERGWRSNLIDLPFQL